MDLYIEKGESRMECELKIAAKYNRSFHILSEKEIRLGGILGLFTKPGVQVEYYFSPSAKSGSSAAPMHSMHTGSFHPGAHASMYASDNRQRRQISNGDLSSDRLEEEKRKVLAAAGGAASGSKLSAWNQKNDMAASGREASLQLLDAINELKEKLGQETAGSKKEDHPAFARVSQLLKANDFSEKYISRMTERLRKELSLEQLDNPDFVQEQLINWIGESISIYKEDDIMRKPRVMILVGPTGVGKTTTLSKLAAIYGIGTDEIPARDVKMITIDAFRICAKEQLMQIGDIMQIPVKCVVNRQELKKEISLLSEDTDLFLIDTIGKSQKDSAKLGEMKEILDGAPRHSEYHLVISADKKTSDIEDILQQFEPFNYKSVILSKMDETSSYGNIISALAEKRKCISYITNGQNVPVDIRKATVVRFLINLEGFNSNRERIEKLFPSGNADQFKWK